MVYIYHGKAISIGDIYDIVYDGVTDDHFEGYLNMVEKPITLVGIKYDVGRVLRLVDPAYFGARKDAYCDMVAKDIIDDPRLGGRFDIGWVDDEEVDE